MNPLKYIYNNETVKVAAQAPMLYFLSFNFFFSSGSLISLCFFCLSLLSSLFAPALDYPCSRTNTGSKNW